MNRIRKNTLNKFKGRGLSARSTTEEHIEAYGNLGLGESHPAQEAPSKRAAAVSRPRSLSQDNGKLLASGGGSQVKLILPSSEDNSGGSSDDCEMLPPPPPDDGSGSVGRAPGRDSRSASLSVEEYDMVRPAVLDLAFSDPAAILNLIRSSKSVVRLIELSGTLRRELINARSEVVAHVRAEELLRLQLEKKEKEEKEKEKEKEKAPQESSPSAAAGVAPMSREDDFELSLLEDLERLERMADSLMPGQDERVAALSDDLAQLRHELTHLRATHATALAAEKDRADHERSRADVYAQLLIFMEAALFDQLATYTDLQSRLERLCERRRARRTNSSA